MWEGGRREESKSLALSTRSREAVFPPSPLPPSRYSRKWSRQQRRWPPSLHSPNKMGHFPFLKVFGKRGGGKQFPELMDEKIIGGRAKQARRAATDGEEEGPPPPFLHPLLFPTKVMTARKRGGPPTCLSCCCEGTLEYIPPFSSYNCMNCCARYLGASSDVVPYLQMQEENSLIE